MRNVATITWLTFHEAWRRWMVLIALAMGVLFILLYATGVAFILDEATKAMARQGLRNIPVPPEAAGFLLLAGLYVVHFLTIMLAIFAAIDAISGEIGSHTIQTIVTKPIRRTEVVLGKWLGYAAMLVLYIGLLTGGVLGTIHFLLHYDPPNALPAVGLFVLNALALLSLSLLLGTRFSTLTNGVALFMLYGLAFMGSWVEQIGSVLNADAAVRLGQVTSWVLPVETLWRRVAYMLEPPPSALMGGRIESPFSAISVPPESMIPYTAAYAVVMLLLAMWAFSRRDL
ncbi:MAG TPA: ABC transporter permease [Chloroflexia bacterium]|nr:ABC transporter permease [Chloroflexia bacterium]